MRKFRSVKLQILSIHILKNFKFFSLFTNNKKRRPKPPFLEFSNFRILELSKIFLKFQNSKILKFL